ncbi:hypothetical protein NKH18_17440 [Streptomyces sp. M10(2022)]
MSSAELDAIGVTLSAGRAAEAILRGGELAVTDLGLDLTPQQQVHLLLRRAGVPGREHRGGGAGSGRRTGRGRRDQRSGGQVRRFGAGTGREVRLFLDGTAYTREP